MADFLNQLFNTLNWCISEFSVGVEDLKQLSTDRRRDTMTVQQRVLIMYELAGSLMRVLEIVALHAAQRLFASALHRVNMQRAMEACLSILDRMILFPDRPLLVALLRQHRLTEALSDRRITHPTFGVLTTLYACDAALMVDTLVAQAGLTTAIVEFLTVQLQRQAGPSLLAAVAAAQARGAAEEEAGLKRVASTDLCFICCTLQMDTRFLPCQHMSCATCIQRHLLNSKKCFFCNTEIASTQPL